METPTIDLGTLDINAVAERGVEFELVHPTTSEPLGVFITVVGGDSDRFRETLYDVVERRQNRKITPEITRNNNIEIAARNTLSWRNVMVDGQELPFSIANARTLYGRFNWIREQVNDFVGDRANFLAK